jgi:hypothetical protein
MVEMGRGKTKKKKKWKRGMEQWGNDEAAS